MATIAELRAKVRSQTEQTSGELADETIDSYLQEAFNRTIAAENQWPFYEETWTLTQTAGDSFATLPTDAAEIMSIVDVDNNRYRLRMLDHETAEDDFSGPVPTGGYAFEFSVWKSVVYFWPAVTFSTDRHYQLRGYRSPADWLAGPSTNSPDCDERLHLPLAHYAIALSYAKQEDETLEATYMDRWQRDVEAIRKAIMDPPHHLPLVFGPRRWGNRRRRNRLFQIDHP